MSWSGMRNVGAGYIPTTMEIFAKISQRIHLLNMNIKESVVEIKFVSSMGNELRLLKIEIEKQTVDQRHATVKEKLLKQIASLEKYVGKLQNGIKQLHETNALTKIAQDNLRLKKTSQQKGIYLLPEEMILYIYQFLSARDISRGSNVSKFFKEILYSKPLLDHLIFLSGFDLVLKLDDFKPTPTLEQFNQARKKAMNSSRFSFASTKLKTTPKFLKEILEEGTVDNTDSLGKKKMGLRDSGLLLKLPI